MCFVVGGILLSVTRESTPAVDGALNDLRTANKAVKGTDKMVSQLLAKACRQVADNAVMAGRKNPKFFKSKLK